MKIKVCTTRFDYLGLGYGDVVDVIGESPKGVTFTRNGKYWALDPSDYTIEFGVSEAPEEYTGSSSSYYKVHIATPVTAEEPYDAECLDIIQALDMTWGEANVFKATWRKAAARKGLKKKGNTAVYDAEKMVFFSQREEVLERAKEGK